MRDRNNPVNYYHGKGDFIALCDVLGSFGLPTSHYCSCLFILCLSLNLSFSDKESIPNDKESLLQGK